MLQRCASRVGRSSNGCLRQSQTRTAFRKYSTPVTKDLKYYNVQLNKCFKMKYFAEGYNTFAEMKQANVAPDATTYNLMFKLYGENSDSNAINALFDEVKAAGLKTQITDFNEQYNQLLDNPDVKGPQILRLQVQFLRQLKSGINPFLPSN